MKVLIISDTHGKDENMEQVLMMESPVDLLIHCGDVEGREDYIEALADCPVCMVAGNNDFFSDLQREEQVTVAGKKILVTHGHYYGVALDTREMVEEARYKGCDMVFYGHTHRPELKEEEGIVVLNPGSLTYPRQNGRKPSYAVLETDGDGKLEIEIKYLKR